MNAEIQTDTTKFKVRNKAEQQFVWQVVGNVSIAYPFVKVVKFLRQKKSWGSTGVGTCNYRPGSGTLTICCHEAYIDHSDVRGFISYMLFKNTDWLAKYGTPAYSDFSAVVLMGTVLSYLKEDCDRIAANPKLKTWWLKKIKFFKDNTKIDDLEVVEKWVQNQGVAA